METWFNYFWLLAIAINSLNTVIIWARVQTYIHRNPELRSGYLRLLRGFWLGMSGHWLIMGLGLTRGGLLLKDYFYPSTGTLWVIAWWLSVWVSILLLSYWLCFRGGAEMLIQHPGFFRTNPSNSQTIKLMAIILLFTSIVTSIIIFLQTPS